MNEIIWCICLLEQRAVVRYKGKFLQISAFFWIIIKELLHEKKKWKCTIITKGMIIQFSDINMVFPLNCITVTNTDISQKKHHLPFCITSTFLGKWQLYQVPFQVFSDTHIPCLLSEHCIHHLFVLCFSVFLSFPSYETCFTLTRLFLQTTK